jgi:hypothetical protein
VIEQLLSRPVVVGLAILGAALSVAASALIARGKIGPQQARRLNLAGYAAMGLSMLLFVLAGLRGAPP